MRCPGNLSLQAINLFFCISVSTFGFFFLSKEYLRAAKTFLMHGEDILETIFVLACIEDFSCKIDDVQSFFFLSFLNFVELLAVLKLACCRSHLIISAFFIYVGLEKGCSFEGYKLMALLAFFWTYSDSFVAITALSPRLALVRIESTESFLPFFSLLGS